MKKIVTAFLCVLFLGLSFSGVAQAQEKIQLKYDFVPGTALDYQMHLDGNISVEVVPQGKPALPKNFAQINGDFKYTHEVTAIDKPGDAATVKVTYGASSMNTIVNDQIVPNADVPMLAGKAAEVRVSSRGEVLDFTLPPDLPKSMQNADFRKMFAVFPDRQLRIGESWVKSSQDTNSENDNFSVSTTMQATYTLVGVETRGRYECAKVRVESNTDTVTKSKKPEVVLDGQSSGRIEGFIYYDLKRGYIVYSALNTRMNNRVTTGGKAQNTAAESTVVTTILDTNLNAVTQLL